MTRLEDENDNLRNSISKIRKEKTRFGDELIREARFETMKVDDDAGQGMVMDEEAPARNYAAAVSNVFWVSF